MSKLLKRAAYLQEVIDFFDLWPTEEQYYECLEAIDDLKAALDKEAADVGLISYLEV